MTQCTIKTVERDSKKMEECYPYSRERQHIFRRVEVGETAEFRVGATKALFYEDSCVKGMHGFMGGALAVFEECA